MYSIMFRPNTSQQMTLFLIVCILLNFLRLTQILLPRIVPLFRESRLFLFQICQSRNLFYSLLFLYFHLYSPLDSPVLLFKVLHFATKNDCNLKMLPFLVACLNCNYYWFPFDVLHNTNWYWTPAQSTYIGTTCSRLYISLNARGVMWYRSLKVRWK